MVRHSVKAKDGESLWQANPLELARFWCKFEGTGLSTSQPSTCQAGAMNLYVGFVQLHDPMAADMIFGSVINQLPGEPADISQASLRW